MSTLLLLNLFIKLAVILLHENSLIVTIPMICCCCSFVSEKTLVLFAGKKPISSFNSPTKIC